MLARGSHINIILFNSFNNFRFELTLIQYPLLIESVLVLYVLALDETKIHYILNLNYRLKKVLTNKDQNNYDVSRTLLRQFESLK
jgi:hypothetical protein